MNHSGIGKLISNNQINIPNDLLVPLSITEGVIVWGIYYPNLLELDEHESIKHDFVLSPIPFDLWGRSARLLIRTKHEIKTFKILTDILLSENASILDSEASRSAFHYDTWALTICFDGIKDLVYCKEQKAFKETLN